MPDRRKDCPLCDVVAGGSVDFLKAVERYPRHFVAEPVAAIAPGHVIVFLDDHIGPATEAPIRAGHLTERAARHAQMEAAANIVLSCGTAATQTVDHLHAHVIPRGDGDGLPADWPWRRGGITDMPT